MAKTRTATSERDSRYLVAMIVRSHKKTLGDLSSSYINLLVHKMLHISHLRIAGRF